MNQVLPPVGDEELRHIDDKHLGGHRATATAHVLQDHRSDVAVGRGQESQRHRHARRTPLAQHPVFFLVIGDDRDEFNGRR